jgi:hypothetical protein
VDLLDNALCADGVNLSSLDYLKTTVSIVLVVRQSAEGCADTSMNVRIIPEKALLAGMVEISSIWRPSLLEPLLHQLKRRHLRLMLACLLGAPPNTFGFQVSRCESK